MNIILEGPDGAGKSTLATALAQRTGATIYHQGPYDKDVIGETIALVSGAEQPAIFDRLHVGERAYGPVHRDRDMLEAHGQRALDRWLASLGAVVVIVYPGWSTVLKHWRARREEEMLADEKDLFQVTRRFVDPRSPARAHAHLPIIEHDWRRETVDALLCRIRIELTPVNYGPGIGWFLPGNVLVVGEQVGDTSGPETPFVGASGSSRWLNELLHVNRIPERELYWINALTREGDETDASFLAVLTPRHVVALGRVAGEWCERNVGGRWDWTRCDHPQHHKRFHYGEPYRAIYLLKELVS